MKNYPINKTILLLTIFVQFFVYAQSSNVAPILTASGNQIYCPGSSMKIVTNMTIVDPDDAGVDAVYVQISSGYQIGQDLLTLTGFHPTIVSSWNTSTGKLTLTGIAGQPTYIALVAAIKDIEYSNNTTYPTGTKTFSISIGQANYLPSNGHYYQYIPNIGITWNNAKIAAPTNFYYGIQGYLATITASDEAQLSGAQAAGAGWIGGSDEQTEGVWKWMTGPEAGTIMTFTFWNTGEPNNLNDEDYTHVTAPGVGIPGSWNDISNTGNSSGDYQPKGYIVEYGGMPGDPTIQISTSTTITIPSITSSSGATICNSGSVTLQATATIGTINWYTNATGGTSIANGTSFTTPILTSTTTYYADVFPAGCTTGTRTAVTATINNTPIIAATSSVSICSTASALLTASTSIGIINWYSSSTSTIPVATGLNFTTPLLTQDTTYYVEGNNNGCLSASRIPVNVYVFPLPTVADETKILCENSTIILDTGVSNATYLWSTTETTPNIVVTTPGIYNVTVTSLAPQLCSKTKTITVIEHNIPQIQEVVVVGNLATILISGFGDFEYSIDGIIYQDSNVFTVADGGLYTAFVREKFNCGDDQLHFIVITIPEFFTPNNDGINDYWIIKGLIYYPKAEVKIFDRFGKAIIKLSALKYAWDGTLNGKLLTSDDYWYVFKIDENSPEVKGHFSMKR
ncbi:T9SS type B sorting domain-containing protein [Flavobacterium sp.]|uniref:Ig-like domain-containing protein n=1 Tax=Flavobacterium sp. TaxID=239 RepID=UPI0037512089